MTQATLPPLATLPAAANVVLDGPGNWRHDSLTPDAWRLSIPDAVLAELEAVVAQVNDPALPVQRFDAAQYSLTASTAFMRTVREQLEHGVMFAVLDRLPVERWTKHQATVAYWLLSSVMSRPVQQTVSGTMLFDVLDLGLASKMKPGSGIRATVTNLDLNFHNDNCFNTVMPDVVGLLCLRGAVSGGESKAISFYAVHNYLREHHPELLARLYQPVWWDRHREFEEGEDPCVANPVFETRDGRPLARFSIYNITGGYRIRDEQPDPVLRAALDQVVALFNQREFQQRFTMAPGEIQFVNNRTIGHARTDFIDGEHEDQRRHLVRLWLRDNGTVRYAG